MAFKSISLKKMFIWMLVVVVVSGTLPGGLTGTQVSAAEDGIQVTYDDNGADSGDVPVDPTLYGGGDLVVVHDNSGGLTKEGYVFAGWNTKADGTGTDYLPGQTFTLGTENVTLYAKWVFSYTTWINRQVSSSQAMNDVAYLDGMFFGAGANGLIATTIDGTVWTKQESGVDQELHDIAGGNGRYVAVGENGTILLSTDGVNWLKRKSGTSSTLRGVAYGDGLYAAVGDGGTIVISKNGSSWIPVASGTSYHLYAVTHTGEVFVAVGEEGATLISADGLEWSVQDIGPTLNSVAAGNGLAVAVGLFGTILVSSDLEYWSVSSLDPSVGDIKDVIYGNGKFWLVGTDWMRGFIYESSDGSSWSVATAQLLKNRTGIAYGDGLLVTVGVSDILSSDDGASWTAYESAEFHGVNFVNNQYVAVGEGVYYSANGAVWRKALDSTVILRDIAYGEGVYVAVGDEGTVLTATDLSSWTDRASQTDNDLYGVVYADDKFVAVGDAGTVIYSDDGVDWQASDSGGTLDIRDVTYGNGKFVAVGHGADATYHGKAYWTSDLGQKWSSYTTLEVSLNGIAYGNDEFYAAGIGNNPSYKMYNMYRSVTGDTWDWSSRSTSGITDVTYYGIAFYDNTYAIVGTGGTIRTMKKGTGWWIGATTGVSTEFRSVAGGKGAFVAVGEDGTIFQTRGTAPVSYTVHFDSGDADTKANPAFMTLLAGDELGFLPEPPTRAGYVFNGWNTASDGTGDAVDASLAVNADTVLYAQWRQLLPAPANLTSTAGVGEVALEWDGVTGADSYSVYRHEGAHAPADPKDWVLVASGLTETSYTVTGLTNGTTYAFAVAAADGDGTGVLSAPVTDVPGGNGTPEHPYMIWDADRLNILRTERYGYYVLVDDIDMSDYGEWVPVGVHPVTGESESSFGGSLDGQGHTISGLKVRQHRGSMGYAGLFGEIGYGGNIQNLVMTDVDIASVSYDGGEGALAGRLSGGTITNVRVIGGTVTGYAYTGGLVGQSVGGIIHASCADVRVKSEAPYAGGLTGLLQFSVLTQSCAKGEVSGSGFIGGLVGLLQDSEITDAYASGSVTGGAAIGGLFGGTTQEANASSTILTRVYAVGEVTATDKYGGLVGDHYNNFTMTSAYYDRDTTGQSDEGPYSGTPIAHEDMAKVSTFPGWDFETVWHMDDRVGRPIFEWEDDTPPIMSRAKVTNEAPQQVSVYFPEKITADAAALGRFKVTVDGVEVTVTNAELQPDGKELILTLAAPVGPKQEVKVVYTDGEPPVTDKTGNRMKSGPIKADNGVASAFEIDQFAPADNATGVATNTPLVMTFNDTVEAVSGKFIYLMKSDGTLVEKIEATSPRVQVTGQTVTIALSEELLPLQGYHVLIDAGAFRHAEDDEHGGIADASVWNFATAGDPDAEWVTVGEDIASDDAADPIILVGPDGTLYVLFADQSAGGKATVLKRGPNDSDWSPVGDRGFSSGPIDNPTLLVDGDKLYAAFGVGDSVQVMEYDLNHPERGWTQVGSLLDASDSASSNPSLVMHNGELHVGYRDDSGSMTVKKRNALGDWETVGSAGFAPGEIHSPSLIVVDGKLYAGFQDDAATGNKATVMSFNETSGDWEFVGERGFTPGSAQKTKLATDGKDLLIVYEDQGNHAAAMRYDADNDEWVDADGGAGFSGGQVNGLAVTSANGDIYVAYQDASNGSGLTVKKYAGGVWADVGGAGVTNGPAYGPSLAVHDGVVYAVYTKPDSPGELSVVKYGVFGNPNPNPNPAPGDSTLSRTTATFDKNTDSVDYKNIVVEVALNGNAFAGLWNGQTQLVEGTDYTVTVDLANNKATVTILKSYLEKQEDGNLALTFKFNAGRDQTLTVTIKDTTPLDGDIPVLRSAVPGNAQVTLSWSPLIGATEYKVYTSTTSGSYGTAPDTVTGSVYSYTVSNLTNGTTYYFTVTAVKNGVEGEHSNEKSAVPFTVPGKPTNVTAVAGNGMATVTFTPPSDNGGRAITGYKVTVYPGGLEVTGTTTTIVITGLTNGVSYTFTVVAINEAGSGAASDPSNAVVPSASANSGGNNGGGGGSGPAPVDREREEQENAQAEEESVIVLVNGREEYAGKAAKSTRNDQTVTTVIVDEDKLNAKLEEEGRNAVVTIPVPSGSDVSIGELNGQMVKNMEALEAILELRNDRATYTIPARLFNIDEISARLGADVALQDIKIHVEISEPTEDTVKLVKDAVEGVFTMVVPPLEFSVRATWGDTTMEIAKFNAYVKRTLAIPDGVDPSKITTGVVVDPDGTVRHVPTRVIVEDGKYYAVVNSLTNSAYTVIWNPREYRDTVSHWAKNTANNTGSRLIVEETEEGLYHPDADITRAEFAAIIVRALGLKPEQGPSLFADVNETDWYSGAVLTAHEYGLLNGYADGTFRPNEKITREQAMVVLSRAMVITGLKAKQPAQSADITLGAFTDAAQTSGWAIVSVADAVQAGIVTGRSDHILAPRETATKVEVAAMIERLLRNSDLI